MHVTFAWFISSISNSFGSSPFFDAPFRLNSNDFFWTNYYFFWTTFTYLPTFFFLLAALILGIKFYRSWGVYLLFTLAIFYIYIYEVFDLLLITVNTTNIGVFFWQVNTFLLNPLNKYHPFILYCGIISSIQFSYLKLFSSSFMSPGFTNLQVKKNLNLPIRRSYIIVYALFLGSWWAFQEGTWGGWWNWDPSEVFGLLFLFVHLVYIHESVSYVKLTKVYKKVLAGLILLTSIYFFIQLNFEIISHNFGVKFFYFFNNNFFFLLTLNLLLLLLLWLFIKDIHYTKLSALLTLVYPKVLEEWITVFSGLIVLTLLLLIPLSLSFVSTLQYFIHTYFGLNLLNFEFSPQKVLSTFILLLLFFFTRLGGVQSCINLPSSLFFVFSYTLTVLLYRPSLRLVPQLHIYLIIFLALTLLSKPYLITYPLLCWDTLGFSITSDCFTSKLFTYSCNLGLVETLTIFRLNSLDNFMVTWQILYESNSLSLNAYLLPISNLNLSNCYVLRPNLPILVYLIEITSTQSLLLSTPLLLVIPYFRSYFSAVNPTYTWL